MSTSITQSFVKQYEREVHESFQRRGSFMLSTIRHKKGTKGLSTTFQKVGKGIATTKARHGEVTPMNQTHTAVECTLEDFYAGDWVDKLDESKTDHDERLVIANGGAWALGRKADSQIVVKADTTTNKTGSGYAALSRAVLLEAVETLNGNDVPNDGQRFGFLTPRAWSQALTIDEFASADFVGAGDLPFLKGAAPRTWLGVNWLMHTGLTGVGTATANCLVWHRTSIGYGSGEEVKADVTWHGDRAAHFINHSMSGGACLIDGEGVVMIRHDDTAAISTT